MARPRGFDDDDVVERAMEAFWTNGYAGTSPRHLVEATGIGKGSLYNAFGSKRDLFDQSLRRYNQLGGEAAARYLDGPATTRECVGAFLHFLVDMDVQQPVRRGCLTVNTAVELAGHDAEILATIRHMQDHSVAELAARIDRGQRDGDVARDTDPRALAEFLMNTIVGLRVMAKTYDGPTLHRIVDSALDII